MRMEVRVVFDRPRLFLVTSRAILKGEILYWDYKVEDSKEADHYNYYKMISDVPNAVILDSKKKL